MNAENVQQEDQKRNLTPWEKALPEFSEQAVNTYYTPKVDFGLFSHN